MLKSDLNVKVSVMSQAFWLSIRQAILMVVDAIERELNMKPTTAQIREYWKTNSSQKEQKIK